MTGDTTKRFDCAYDPEVIGTHIFENLGQVKDITEQWIGVYNVDRNHAALGKLLFIHNQQRAEFSS